MSGGEGRDTLRDADGFVGAHGGAGWDRMYLTVRAGWLTPSGQASLDGSITGGADEDLVYLHVDGNNDFFVNSHGDEPAGPTANDGYRDCIFLSGAINPGSVFPEWEYVIWQ